MHKLLMLLVTTATLLTAASVWSLSPGEQRIVDRIKAVGSVCLEGEECEGASTAAAAPVASGPRTADEIYSTKCFACHDTGAAGAPKTGDVAGWTARLDDKGMETIIANAINGIGGMPPKGTCGDCSDEEITITVELMIERSK